MTDRTKRILLVLVISIGFTVLVMLLGGSSIELDFGETSLTVTGPQKYQFSVEYEQIALLELVELENAGTLVLGDENRNCRWGQWENEAWQEYTLCMSKKAHTCILITTRDGSHFLFNYQDDETTAEVYRMFSELLANTPFTALSILPSQS